MSLTVNVFKMGHGNVGIDLRGREIFMAKHGLDMADIGPVF